MICLPPRALSAIDLLKEEIEAFHGNVHRALLLTLSASLGQMSNMVFAVSKRGKTKGEIINRTEVGSWVIGYWRPRQHFEVNAWNCFENKAKKLLKAIKGTRELRNTGVAESLNDFLTNDRTSHLSKGDSEFLLDDIPSKSVKLILTDPPHGDRIPYLELSEMWNSVIGLDSNYEDELVVSNAKGRGKNIEAYNQKLSMIFRKCDRVLRDDGLMAVMFNARLKEHWSSLNELEEFTNFRYIGCYPMHYSAGSVVQDNRKGGLKTDYVLLYGKAGNNGRLSSGSTVFESINEWSTAYPNTG